jgi:Fur family transcriptional regulator, ferric uptake regulator
MAPPNTPEPAEVHHTVADRLRADGQRYTGGRRTLVDVLLATDRPLTIAEVLARVDGLAQSSAYRNLAVLERAGAVHRVVGSDEFARFELAEGLAPHHHHLICSSCGQIVDFALDPDVETALETALARIARDDGFSVESHRLDLLGVCGACA